MKKTLTDRRKNDIIIEKEFCRRISKDEKQSLILWTKWMREIDNFNQFNCNEVKGDKVA